jgi:DNA polymerase
MGILTGVVVTDLESRSYLDLRVVGSSVYSRDPSTEVLCMAYNVSGGPIQLWHPGDPVPPVFFDPNYRIAASMTSGFEEEMFANLMTPRHGFPRIPLERWLCIASYCGHAGLRQSLAEVSKDLELGELGKDNAGHLNMMRLCRPQKSKVTVEPICDDFGRWHGGAFDNSPEKHKKNDQYCMKDVIAETEVLRIVPTPPASEQRVWRAHRRINQRGIPIDLALCHGADKIMREELAETSTAFQKLTGVPSPSCREQFHTWMMQQGFVCKRPEDKKENLQADTFDWVLENVEDLRPQVKQAITLASRMSGATAKKYAALIASTDRDGRCRNLLKYYGANTGRWSGMGAQPQNLKKASVEQDVLDKWIDILKTGNRQELIRVVGENKVFEVLGDCIRSTIYAPEGKVLTCSDFSGIEARITAYAAGCESLLEKFRNNEDVYVEMAMKVMGCTRDQVVNPLTGKADTPERKKNRQMGKVPFLGCGYQMGWEKLIATAKKQLDIDVTEAQARLIVDLFRKGYPEIPNFWRDIQNAAEWTVKNDSTQPVGSAMFKFRMFHKNGLRWLTMELPSGRALFFFNPRFRKVVKFGREQDELIYDSPKGVKSLYGGLWTENWVQAFSRDLMAEAIFRCDDHGLECILSCHDELVTLDDENSPEILTGLMETVPSWAEGAPIASETHRYKRYAK